MAVTKEAVMDIKKLIIDDIAALDHLTVSGAENCFIVSAVSNDLKRIYGELDKETENKEEVIS